jgi:hypothetical protein
MEKTMGTRQQLLKAPTLQELEGIYRGALKAKADASGKTKNAWRNAYNRRKLELK